MKKKRHPNIKENIAEFVKSLQTVFTITTDLEQRLDVVNSAGEKTIEKIQHEIDIFISLLDPGPLVHKQIIEGYNSTKWGDDPESTTLHPIRMKLYNIFYCRVDELIAINLLLKHYHSTPLPRYFKLQLNPLSQL